MLNTVIIREMQIRITMRHHFTGVRMANTKRQEIINAGEDSVLMGRKKRLLDPVPSPTEKQSPRSSMGRGLDGRGFINSTANEIQSQLRQRSRTQPVRGCHSPAHENAPYFELLV